MIKRKKQIITQRYKGEQHRGVDLRCVDWKYGVQPSIAPEDGVIIRNSYENGQDSYGNNYVVMRGESGHVYKSIHVRPEKTIKNGKQVIKNEILGFPEIGGNSTALHEHWEIWNDNETEYYDPTRFFIAFDINFDYKR